MKSQQIYYLILQKILIYPHQLGKILEDHASHIDQELLTIMAIKSRLFAAQGNQTAADFLNSLIIQLQEELIIKKETRLSVISENSLSHSSEHHYNLTPSSPKNSFSEQNFLQKTLIPTAKLSHSEVKYSDNCGQEYKWSKWVAILLLLLSILYGNYYSFNSHELKVLEKEWTSYLYQLQNP